MRLDQHVLGVFPALSRAYVARLIDDERVLVNGQPSKPGYKLRAADKVKINFKLAELETIPAIELPILYQDDDVVVINKPLGVISHSRGKYWNEPSVASFVRQLTGQPGDRAGIVHRLDRATSGVMICAKNPTALAYLQKQFSKRQVTKTYRAIVEGHMQPSQAIIDMPIERNPKNPATFRVGANGKAAQTAYKVLASKGRYDEVELIPKTGRTHQLRVHLRHFGHPIVGDELYGAKPAERLFLHAQSLAIHLPDGTFKTFSAPLPDAFNTFMAAA